MVRVMRRSFNGLFGLVQEQLRMDALSGQVQMRPGSIVLIEIGTLDYSKMDLVKDDHMIEAVPADRTISLSQYEFCVGAENPIVSKLELSETMNNSRAWIFDSTLLLAARPVVLWPGGMIRLEEAFPHRVRALRTSKRWCAMQWKGTLPKAGSPAASSFISSMIRCWSWHETSPRREWIEAARALRRLGFEEIRQTGSHRIMRKEKRTVVVPMHRPIKPGTLKGLLEQAGVTVEAFVLEL
jgi:predicted RNA binding protein YcfA (HicA-like mRNA interferase family)